MECQTEDHQLVRYDIVIKTLQHFEVSDEHSGEWEMTSVAALLTGKVESKS